MMFSLPEPFQRWLTNLTTDLLMVEGLGGDGGNPSSSPSLSGVTPQIPGETVPREIECGTRLFRLLVPHFWLVLDLQQCGPLESPNVSAMLGPLLCTPAMRDLELLRFPPLDASTRPFPPWIPLGVPKGAAMGARRERRDDSGWGFSVLAPHCHCQCREDLCVVVKIWTIHPEAKGYISFFLLPFSTANSDNGSHRSNLHSFPKASSWET